MDKKQLIELYPLDWESSKIEAFRQAVLDWYDTNRRDLPWRRSKDPYRIWLSEIMLQQTQVNTVIPYYERFLDALPTVKSLAEAKEELLMSLWQGLGYYSRVRNMQLAAKQVMEEYNGAMPQTLEGLLSLKGIGPYTAGAIASMAFGLAEPALDGNLMRIVSRLFEIDKDISLGSTKKEFMAILYQLIDPNRPGDFNQALMDMGATLMTPSNPRPNPHPLATFDRSYQNGTSHLYPVKLKKTRVTTHQRIAYAIRNASGDWLMYQHQAGELLADLWHFPMIEVEEVREDRPVLSYVDDLLSQGMLSLSETQGRPIVIDRRQLEYTETLPQVKHVFSHRVWEITILPLRLKAEISIVNPAYQWVKADQLADYPQSTLQRKLFQSLASES